MHLEWFPKAWKRGLQELEIRKKTIWTKTLLKSVRILRKVSLVLVWLYGISTIVGYLMPNLFLYISTVIFQTIQFSRSAQFSFIWPIDRTLSAATIPGQSWLGNDGNKGVLYITQSSSITEDSPSDCLVSYLGHALRESYPSAEMQLVYFGVPVDCTNLEKS